MRSHLLCPQPGTVPGARHHPDTPTPAAQRTGLQGDGGSTVPSKCPDDSSPLWPGGTLSQEKPDMLMDDSAFDPHLGDAIARLPPAATRKQCACCLWPLSNAPLRGNQGYHHSGRAGLWGKAPEIPNFIHPVRLPLLPGSQGGGTIWPHLNYPGPCSPRKPPRTAPPGHAITWSLCLITGGLCCAIRLRLTGTGSRAPVCGALPHRTAAQQSSGGRVLGSEPGTPEALRYACLPTCLGHRDRPPDGRQGSLGGTKAAAWDGG